MQHDCAPRPVVGIDVAKDKLDVFIDLPARSLSVVANDDAGRAALVDELRRINVLLVCIEATGRYHRRLAADLLDAGIPVAVVNPQRVREYARATGRLEKTDPIDARVLAEFARAVGPRREEKLPEKQVELRDLVSRRRALVQVRVAEKNRLADDAPKLARAQAQKLLRVVERQIDDLDRAIAKLAERDDDWNHKAGLIASVKGVGAATANQLVAELPELGRLDRQQIAKLVGIAPLSCDSGRRRRGQRHIRGGRHDVRVTLYMGAFNAIQHNPRFRDFAERLVAAGKPFKVIVTAAMRKLLVILNQMVKTNTPWNPALAFQFR